MAMSKKTVAAILMTAVVLLAFAATPGEALSECGKHCMPVCLKEGATISACSKACEEYCRQVDGNPGGWNLDEANFHV